MIRMLLALLLVLSALGSAADWAPPPADELTKSARDVRRNAFVVGRGLDEYSRILSPVFAEAAASLQGGQVWLDVGAGEARAMVEHLARGGKGRLVAIAVERPKTASSLDGLARSNPGRFEYREGRYIEEYAAGELPAADLVTDVFGAFAYSPHPDVVLARVAAAMKPGGRLLTHVIRGVTGPGGDGLGIADENGKEVPLERWLGAARGLRLARAIPRTMNAPIELVRTEEPVEVPSLELVRFKAGGPPMRRYVWRDAR
jgi:SAM-dependent methyltransferase